MAVCAMSDKQPDYADNKLVKSALWCVSARWVIKIFGMISAAILLRLLAPEDFGIVAKAVIILGFFEVFILTKFSFGLVRIQNPEKQDYDTAFTLNVLLGCVVFTAINGIALFSDQIMQDADVPFLVHILSIRTLFYMIESPRIIDLQKDLYFEKDFYYLIVHKLLSIICSIGFCFYYQNYMGLLFAYLSNAAIMVLLSYIFMPYRPHFTLKKKEAFLNFSLPSMRGNFFTFISSTIDRILPARYISDKMMGVYNLAYELSFQLTNEIVFPLSRALFPIFSNIEHDKKNVSEHYYYVQQFLCAFCTALAVGLFLIAEELVALYAGDQWMEAVPFFQILSLVGAAHVFNQIHCSIFEGTGYVRVKEKMIIAQFITTILAMLPFIIEMNLYYLACAKLAVTALFSCLYVALSMRFYAVSVQNMIIFYGRVLLASLSMIWVYDYIFENLLLQIMGCGLTFVAVHFGLWGLSRNAHMIEAKLLKIVTKRVKKWSI